MSTVRQDYDAFKSRMQELRHLASISGLLGWDQLVMMPPKAASARAQQMEILAGILHEKSTDPELGRLITKLAESSSANELNEWERAHVRDAKRDYEREVKIPKDLAQKIAKLSSEGYEAWVEARKTNDYDKFAPFLQQWVDIRRQEAQLIDSQKDVYDVLLDTYERGISSKTIDQVFDKIKQHLPPLIARIQKAKEHDRSFLAGKEFDVKIQAELNHQIAKELGFDTESGRLDVSVHPMTCDIHVTDVRMTTRYKKDDIIEGLTGTIHETGHSLYEQGRDSENADMPASRAISMGVHESQSLFWERMVGLSLPFWEHYWPKVLAVFPQIPSDTPAHEFYAAINHVKADLIRVEADEVTYPMHIILRYELERDLLSGRVKVSDLPALWNAKMKEYLGVDVPTNSLGVLQDTHWSGGAMGYFPTYTLGAIYASQFFATAKKEIPDLEKMISQGNFKPLKEWLNEKIHRKGSVLASGEELVKQVTGEGLNPDHFIKYLTDKYTKLYDLQ